MKAYLLKESLERLWNYTYEGTMLRCLKSWSDQLHWQRLKPMEKLARMLLGHSEGIVNYCRTKVPLGGVEAVNGNIKAPLRRGRGYPDLNYLLRKAQRLTATRIRTFGGLRRDCKISKHYVQYFGRTVTVRPIRVSVILESYGAAVLKQLTPITQTRGTGRIMTSTMQSQCPHGGWLHVNGTLDQWVAKQAKLGRKFEISSGSDEHRHACDDSGKEVAVEYDFLDPTCCQYDPAFKLRE